jgi:hypothetical protein
MDAPRGAFFFLEGLEGRRRGGDLRGKGGERDGSYFQGGRLGVWFGAGRRGGVEEPFVLILGEELAFLL